VKGTETTLHEWNYVKGTEIQSWRLSGAFQKASAVSPNGQSCVAITYDGEDCLRDLPQQRSVKLNLNALESSSASFSPDGTLLAVGSDLGIVRVWHTATWQPVTVASDFPMSAHTVVFSPDGKRLAVGSGGSEAVKLFDTESWQNVFAIKAENTDGQGLAFSPDGNALGWLNFEGVLQIWRAPSWDEINAAEAKARTGVTQR
jgi:WD40 repeat protein